MQVHMLVFEQALPPHETLNVFLYAKLIWVRTVPRSKQSIQLLQEVQSWFMPRTLECLEAGHTIDVRGSVHILSHSSEHRKPVVEYNSGVQFCIFQHDKVNSIRGLG